MGLFSLFKKEDKVGRDSAVDSQKILKDKLQLSTKKEVKTKLSYHPDWNVPKEQEYLFTYLSSELQPLKPNQLSLAAVSIEENEKTGAWDIKAFFRSSLSQPIGLGEIELILMDKNNKRLGAKTFNFAELGIIPPNSSRPWVFKFDKGDLNPDAEVPKKDWAIAFNLISLRGHQLDLDETWKNHFSVEFQKQLAKLVGRLPKLSKTEVNLTSYQIHQNEEGSLNTIIFFRNGSDKAINLEKLPLEIIDANGRQIAKDSFNFNPVLTVKPNTTKPWTFVFSSKFVNMVDADLTSWTVRIPNK